jgi:tetratricopeptide (TPR) repeat protein
MAFEYRNYLPGIGPILALAGLIGTFIQRRANQRLLAVAVLLAFFILPHLLLYERTQRWAGRQSLTLWMLDRHPESVHGLALAANYLADAGDAEHALAALQRARGLSPEDPAVLFNSIRIHCQLRPEQRFGERLQESIENIPVGFATTNSRLYYNYVVDICPASAVNHDQLLSLYRRFSHSRDKATRALSYYGMGNIHIRNDNYVRALEAWEKAVSYNPQAKTLKKRIRQLRRITDAPDADDD